MTEKIIFNYLSGIGACKACCLRYVLVKSPDAYNDIDAYVKQMQYLNENEISAELTAKKVKVNSCIICLGLLQEFCINETVDKASENEKIKSYDSKVFTCAVSYPMCVQIREHSIMLELERKYSDFYTCETVVTPLNRTWKWMIKDKLASKLNKQFENSETCEFSINITMGYDLFIEELSPLIKMQPNYFNTRQEQKRKFRGELFSRKAVQTVIEMTNRVMFAKFSPVPPTVSDKQLFVEQIDCVHNAIYIAGRYCKYSRELSQTPWFINGEKMMETSVQELIFDPIQKLLQIPELGLKFSSSGREDVDVRCLGIGRPFYLEYSDPKKTMFTYDEFRQIEEDINKNKDIQVRDLQIVPREELVHIKDGEESKTKQYEAICVCKSIAPTDEQLENLGSDTPLILKQKTPIRVLHRRPLAVRQRSIVSMKAEKISDAEDNVFKLILKTQAGTYVKEFVHGDFGRTTPSLTELLNTEVDILTLDVTSIDLDWPKPVEKL